MQPCKVKARCSKKVYRARQLWAGRAGSTPPVRLGLTGSVEIFGFLLTEERGIVAGF